MYKEQKMNKHNLTFTGLVVKEGRKYTALCLELDVASEGSTIREAKRGLTEAATLYLETAIESNLPYIRPVPAEEDPRKTMPAQVVETFALKVNITIQAYA